jgi:hypothetical protein
MWAIGPKFATHAAASQGDPRCVLRPDGGPQRAPRRPIWVIIIRKVSKRMVVTPAAKRSQVLSGCFCLLAMVLLFAPLAGAAWSAHAAACCTGNHCPIPEHHHSKAPQHPSDCAHQMGDVTACSIRCCQSADHPLLASMVFILPLATSWIRPQHATAAAPALQPNIFPRSVEVLAPPPRQSISPL